MVPDSLLARNASSMWISFACYALVLLYTLPPSANPYSHIYSPKSLRTLFSTLSFSGSYGWSLDGISSSEGKAAVYASTRCLIFSAICQFVSSFPCQLPAQPYSTYVLVDQQDSNILALRGEAVKGRLDGAVLRLGVHDEEVLLRVRRLGYVLRCVSLNFSSPAISCGRRGGDSRRRPRAACPSLCPVCVSRGPLSGGGRTHLVANDGEELPVFVCGGRGCHVRLCVTAAAGEAACAGGCGRAMTTAGAQAARCQFGTLAWDLSGWKARQTMGVCFL
jgi:hypothetical protein